MDKIENKVALKVVQNGHITLKDVRVPEANRLQGGNSFRDTAKVLKMTRYAVGWMSTGCAMGAYEAALKYAQERLQFGKPIGSFQLIQDLLARMIENITASQCLLVRQAQLFAEGKLSDAHAALSKAFCTSKCRETVAWAREIRRRQRHRGRLQGRSLLQRLRSALHLRGHLPDAKPDRRQSDNRLERLSVIKRLTNNLNFKQEPFMSTTTTELNLETVSYAKKGAIAYVTLNRPKVLNALNKRTWEDLKAAFEDAQDDAAVRGVILTGAGDKAFIAGADISELAQITRRRS